MVEDRFGRDNSNRQDMSALPAEGKSQDLAKIEATLKKIGYITPGNPFFAPLPPTEELLRLGKLEGRSPLNGFFASDTTPSIIVAAEDSFYRDKDEKPLIDFYGFDSGYTRWQGSLMVDTSREHETTPLRVSLASSVDANFALVEVDSWDGRFREPWGEVEDDRESVMVVALKPEWYGARFDMALLTKGWQKRLFAEEQSEDRVEVDVAAANDDEPAVRATLRSRFTQEEIEEAVRKAHERSSSRDYEEDRGSHRGRRRNFGSGLSADQIANMLANVTVTDGQGNTHFSRLGAVDSIGSGEKKGNRPKSKFERKARRASNKAAQKKSKK